MEIRQDKPRRFPFSSILFCVCTRIPIIELTPSPHPPLGNLKCLVPFILTLAQAQIVLFYLHTYGSCSSGKGSNRWFICSIRTIRIRMYNYVFITVLLCIVHVHTLEFPCNILQQITDGRVDLWVGSGIRDWKKNIGCSLQLFRSVCGGVILEPWYVFS